MIQVREVASDAATVGGLVVQILCRLSAAGDVVELEGHRLTVLKVRRRAIAHLRIESLQAALTSPDDM